MTQLVLFLYLIPMQQPQKL